MRQSFSVGIGGAAGQGVATPGDIFAKIFSRRGLHLNVYNAYQSIIRGGHTFLTIRTGPDKIASNASSASFGASRCTAGLSQRISLPVRALTRKMAA